jgi:hypothetical protein
VPGPARALVCHRAKGHGTARLTPHRVVLVPGVWHGGTKRHGPACRCALPCPCLTVPVPNRASAVPCRAARLARYRAEAPPTPGQRRREGIQTGIGRHLDRSSIWAGEMGQHQLNGPTRKILIYPFLIFRISSSRLMEGS